MIRPLSPDAFVACANGFIGVHEERPTGRGQLIEYMLHEVHAPIDAPWHAAFVYHVGYWSHFDHLTGWSAWPLPATADGDDLWRFASERGIGRVGMPIRGNVFLQWSRLRRRYLHTGIVVHVEGTTVTAEEKPCFECRTIEASIDESGRLAEHGIHRNIRQLCPDDGDRFVRWVDLDTHAVAGEPRAAVEVCMGRMVWKAAA